MKMNHTPLTLSISENMDVLMNKGAHNSTATYLSKPSVNINDPLVLNMA